MQIEIIKGILIPFLGTSLGAMCVFFMKKSLSENIERALNGFASGIMISASIWSLLIPSINLSSNLGKLSFIPAIVGFILGILFLLALNHITNNMENTGDNPKDLKKNNMLMFAVTLHNIPEGMAIGVIYAGYLAGDVSITLMSAIALSIGIAIQNFPEGLIISMPLKANGMSTVKSFIFGVLSGIVEPIGAFFTILCASIVVPILPYLLSFASGAMVYVVIEELMPTLSNPNKSNSHIGTIFFSIGFLVMMILDVTFG